MPINITFAPLTQHLPRCEQTAAGLQILNQMEVPYETVDVLSNDMLRSGMKEYSQVRHTHPRNALLMLGGITLSHAAHAQYRLLSV